MWAASETPKGTIARGSLICKRGDDMEASESITIVDQHKVLSAKRSETWCTS